MKNTAPPSISRIFPPRVVRAMLLAAGLACTALGAVGIFLPLLPTTPLLLLAAACFARSSSRFHSWLTGHRHLGPFISGYLDGRGIPLRAKVMAISLVWLTITPTVLFVVPLLPVKILLIAIALSITVYLMRLPLRNGEDDS